MRAEVLTLFSSNNISCFLKNKKTYYGAILQELTEKN